MQLPSLEIVPHGSLDIHSLAITRRSVSLAHLPAACLLLLASSPLSCLADATNKNVVTLPGFVHQSRCICILEVNDQQKENRTWK